MNPSLIQLLAVLAGRSAQRGTLIDIVETFAKLVRLIEPLLDKKPDATSGQ